MRPGDPRFVERGRHMADTAAHLANRVLPRAAARQWVLSLPFGLRYRLAHDRELTADVLRVFVRASFGSLRRRSRPELSGRGRARCGGGSGKAPLFYLAAAARDALSHRGGGSNLCPVSYAARSLSPLYWILAGVGCSKRIRSCRVLQRSLRFAIVFLRARLSW